MNLNFFADFFQPNTTVDLHFSLVFFCLKFCGNDICGDISFLGVYLLAFFFPSLPCIFFGLFVVGMVLFIMNWDAMNSNFFADFQAVIISLKEVVTFCIFFRHSMFEIFNIYFSEV
jgi:hypothetical protein